MRCFNPGGCTKKLFTQNGVVSFFIHQATLSLHVPVAPNDAGLTVGGLWAFEPPLKAQALQYLSKKVFVVVVVVVVALLRCCFVALLLCCFFEWMNPEENFHATIFSAIIILLFWQSFNFSED